LASKPDANYCTVNWLASQPNLCKDNLNYEKNQMRYLDDLIEACETAKLAKPVQEFIMSDLDELKNIKTAIYVITELDGDPSKTFEAFKAFKEKTERKCAKINHASSTLYVGSSTTGLHKRIQQHLGNGHKSTYALHLSHWTEGRRIEIKVSEYNVSRTVLQLIEDAKSSMLKPAFGKLGGNNK